MQQNYFSVQLGFKENQQPSGIKTCWHLLTLKKKHHWKHWMFIAQYVLHKNNEENNGNREEKKPRLTTVGRILNENFTKQLAASSKKKNGQIRNTFYSLHWPHCDRSLMRSRPLLKSSNQEQGKAPAERCHHIYCGLAKKGMCPVVLQPTTRGQTDSDLTFACILYISSTLCFVTQPTWTARGRCLRRQKSQVQIPEMNKGKPTHHLANVHTASRSTIK